GSPEVPGQISFAGNVSLSLARSLTLDAASFVSEGGQAHLAAAYVSLGQSRITTQDALGSTAAGSGQLDVDASFIDLIGHSAFSACDRAALSSRGDIRANGVATVAGAGAAPNPQFPGGLTVSGTLNLTAQQVYPSTLTNFALTAGAGGSGAINIGAAPGTAPA